MILPYSTSLQPLRTAWLLFLKDRTEFSESKMWYLDVIIHFLEEMKSGEFVRKYLNRCKFSFVNE